MIILFVMIERKYNHNKPANAKHNMSLVHMRNAIKNYIKSHTNGLNTMIIVTIHKIMI